MTKSLNCPRAAGAINRLQGEPWAEFSVRQREAQAQQLEAKKLAAKAERWRRQALRESRQTHAWYENLDHDQSMNG